MKQAYKEEFSVAILRPPEASRLSLVTRQLEDYEHARGLEIDAWVRRFRKHAENIADLLGCHVQVVEHQIHAHGSIVPNYDRRKRLKKADLIAAVDPDALFFEFLEEGPFRENPMAACIVGQLTSNRDVLKSIVNQMPKADLLTY